MATQEVLHAGVEEEAKEDLPREAQDGDEGHQRPARSADDQVPELPPIDLSLFAGQRAQAQIGFRRRPWSVASDDMAELAWSAAIATFLHHRVQTAGGQRREPGQGLVDERQIRIEFRRAVRRSEARQTSLGQNPGDRVAVDAQLLGDRPNAPFFDVVIAQDLRLEVRGNGHGEVLFGCSKDLGCAARSRGEQVPDNVGRNDGNAIAAGWICPSAIVPSRRPPGPRTTDHPFDPAGNPDASRYFCAPGNDVPAPHD
jgi:hypothetical protein